MQKSKLYTVAYTLYKLEWSAKSNALAKMNVWSALFPPPSQEEIKITTEMLSKLDISQDNTGSFDIVQTKSKQIDDLIVFPEDNTEPIILSIKINKAFLRHPSPEHFEEEAGISDTDFMIKYKDITRSWYEEVCTKFGGRFPLKEDKVDYYVQINNLIKSFLITYDAKIFIKFILNTDETNRYIIKYNKNSANVYKIDIDLNKYNINIGDIKGDCMYISLHNTTKKEEPIKIQLSLKNKEAFVRRNNKNIFLQYTPRIKNFERFVCLRTRLPKEKPVEEML